MKMVNRHSGFTLVEVLVAMTIFSMTMVSVMVIYASATQIALKTDINREMQQNIKSVIESIAEDIRKNGIVGVGKHVSIATPNPYKIESGGNKYYTGSRLQTGTGSLGQKTEYRLYGFDSNDSSKSIGNGDSKTNSFCADIKNICYINKGFGGNHIGPLSNSKISFTHLEFYVTNGDVPKVTINFTARPAIKNGLRPDLIQNAELYFQTTISERHLQVK